MDDAEVASRYDDSIFTMVLKRLVDTNNLAKIVHAEGLSEVQLHQTVYAFIADVYIRHCRLGECKISCF